mgnify:CR=1 FL=1
MATRIKLIDTGLSPTLAGGTFTGHIDLGDNNKWIYSLNQKNLTQKR